MSENYALLIFGIIIIISAVIAWFMESHEYFDNTRFHTFIVILAGLGIIITFLLYYNLISIQGQQQQLAGIQELARINDSMLNSVLNEMKTASLIIPNFVLSITPLTNAVCCSTGTTAGTGCEIPTGVDLITPQSCTEKMVLSYRIFALWQDTITSNRLINFDATAYISNFLQRANSSQLYVQWTAARIDFESNTQVFGDLLFEYGLPITIQTPQEYNSVASQLMNDSRYKNIMKK